MSVVLLLLLGSGGLSQAQVATPTARLGWDQVAGTLAEAQGFLYEATWDGGPFQPLPGVTCSGAAPPFLCSAPFIALTPGVHTVALRASNSAGTSAPSEVFTFTFAVLPGVPTNIRIVPGN